MRFPTPTNVTDLAENSCRILPGLAVDGVEELKCGTDCNTVALLKSDAKDC